MFIFNWRSVVAALVLLGQAPCVAAVEPVDPVQLLAGAKARSQGLNQAELPSVTPEEYGARGDGERDDTAAIRLALQEAQRSGKTLRLQRWYRVAAPLTVGARVNIAGIGSDSGLRAAGRWNQPVMTVAGSDVTILDLTLSAAGAHVPQLLKILGSRVKVANVRFVGAGQFTHAEEAANAELRPLAAVWIQAERGRSEVTDVIIERGEFSDNGAMDIGGYELVANYLPGDASRIVIRDSRFRAARTTIAVGLFDTSEARIIGNDIDQGGNSDETTDHAARHQHDGYGVLIYNTPAAAQPCTANLVARNRVVNTAYSGIYLQGNIRSQVIGNEVSGACQVRSKHFVADGTVSVGAISANAGNRASPEAVSIVVAANVIRGSGSNGVSVANTRNALVTDNVIQGVAKHGIDARNKEPSLRIVRNVVREAGGAGVSLTAETGPSEDVWVVGNQVDGAMTGILVRDGAVRPRLIANKIARSRGAGIEVRRAMDAEVTGNAIQGDGGSCLRAGGIRSVVVGNELRCAARSVAVQVLPSAESANVSANQVWSGGRQWLRDEGKETSIWDNAEMAGDDRAAQPR